MNFHVELKHRKILRAAIPHFALPRVDSRGQSQLKRADLPLPAASEALAIDPVRAAHPART